MKKVVFTLIALSLSTAAVAEKDRRHWRDRINDVFNYRDRFDDGSRRVRTYNELIEKPSRLYSEKECRYVERVDIYGERFYTFICER